VAALLGTTGVLERLLWLVPEDMSPRRSLKGEECPMITAFPLNSRLFV